MSEKYKDKYRIQSARLQCWDYGWNAAYFVTICTQNRDHHFGDIIEGTMRHSQTGIFAQKFWHEIPDHFPFVMLDAFVVMPNHVHGIIVIIKTDGEPAPVETLHATSLLPQSMPKIKNEKMAAISPKSGSLSTIIRSYKSVVSKHAHKINPGFAWQTRFYDHIIRNEKSFNTIGTYIINNPEKWYDDKYYE